jgi:hypothetical protein
MVVMRDGNGAVLSAQGHTYKRASRAIERKNGTLRERQLFAVTLVRSRICIIPLVLIEQINEALLNVCLSESGDKIKIQK